MSSTGEHTVLSRRSALKRTACGFGYLAAAAMANREALAAVNPLAARNPHFRPRAKRVIFLFMQGGPSHVDTFDYKPLLEKENKGKGNLWGRCTDWDLRGHASNS